MEQTDIIHTVTHHNQSVETDVHIETGVLIGIKTCGAQYIGMRRSAGHYLDPAYMLADAAAFSATHLALHVDLESGLHEGEESRSHTYGNVSAENLTQYALYQDLTGSKGYILINDKRLILEESSLMMRIRSLISVHASGINESVGRLVCLHVTYAAARKMWP